MQRHATWITNAPESKCDIYKSSSKLFSYKQPADVFTFIVCVLTAKMHKSKLISQVASQRRQLVVNTPADRKAGHQIVRSFCYSTKSLDCCGLRSAATGNGERLTPPPQLRK